MKKQFLILVLGISISFVAIAQQRYCNARSQYCMSYPAGFLKEEDSLNSTITSFISKDKKTEITTYGGFYDDEDPFYSGGFAGFFEWQISLFRKQDGYVINNYVVRKLTWCIFSGEDKNGNTIYFKVLKKTISYREENDSAVVFPSITIEYPTAQQAIYEDYVNYIAKWDGK